jgi:hypothetical protein
MQTITLEIDNLEDAEMILLLAKRMKFRVIEGTKPTNGKGKNLKKAFSHLDAIAKLGTLQQAIPDPVKWQRMNRKDRNLPRK